MSWGWGWGVAGLGWQFFVVVNDYTKLVSFVALGFVTLRVYNLSLNVEGNGLR